MYRQHWNQIRTRFSRRNRLLNWYNFRLYSLLPSDITRHLDDIFNDQNSVFKLNVSFGFILRNNESNALQYHYASRNNEQVFEEPFLIATRNDLLQVITAINDLDVLTWAQQRRPNSKWIVDLVTNMTVFITKITNHPIGHGQDLPPYITRNRGFMSLVRQAQTGKRYRDNLCFFRALALQNGCDVKSLETETKSYFERYLKQSFASIIILCQLIIIFVSRFCENETSSVAAFPGVRIDDLPRLETMFETNIYVYTLEPIASTPGSRQQTTAHPVYRSFQHYPKTLHLNLYNNHFSFINNLKIYSKSFCCSRCGKYWKEAFTLKRHEQTCEAKVKHRFPGGVFKIPKTIFELLEEEGIRIPQDLKFFPFYATFDFECFFQDQTLPNHTEKVHWEAEHVPLSVSVCSNVPDFDLPKCFVTDGDSKTLVENMVDYLTTVSQKSYKIIQERFREVFTEIDERIKSPDSGGFNEGGEEEEKDGTDDEDDERGIDVMNSDEEDEEDIESETEEDRMFLDDDTDVDIEDVSFYRAFDLENERNEVQSEEQEDEQEAPNVARPKISFLKRLKSRLDEYLKKLPVVGFNSGKYDLNVIKKFLAAYLVKNKEMDFIVKRNNNFMCLQTQCLRFLDVTNFLAPGFSYSKFLKAYDCPQTKGV